MPEWCQLRWYGPAELVEAARGTLTGDPRLGGIIPPPEEALRILDGLASLTVIATEAIPTPAGLQDDRSETVAALQGSF